MAKVHFSTEIKSKLNLTIEHFPANSLFLGEEEFADLQQQLLANMEPWQPANYTACLALAKTHIENNEIGGPGETRIREEG